jgi:hypothetical protein
MAEGKPRTMSEEYLRIEQIANTSEGVLKPFIRTPILFLLLGRRVAAKEVLKGNPTEGLNFAAKRSLDFYDEELKRFFQLK